MQYLHLSKMLNRQARELVKAGKKGERAVATYEMIIDSLRHAGSREDSVFSKRTKKGEQRMKNCVKYDLGGGYRLITVLAGEHLFIPFLGDHDDTDTWFNRHRNDTFQPDEALYESERIATAETGQDEQVEGVAGVASDCDEDPYEEELMAKLDDSMLRSVFQGLYKNRAASAEQLPYEG